MRNQCFLLFGLIVTLGCTPSQQDDPGRPAEEPAVNAEVHFDLARIYLPHGSNRENPAHLLAPIIVHQSIEEGKAGAPPWLSPKGDKPQVHLLRSEIKINEISCPQFIYSWEYGTGTPTPASQRILRMTLDSRGYPMIFELYTGEGRLAAVYVSRSLEEAAAEEHGPPLAGRNFSGEAARGPGLSGIVDEGPVPMGPLAYFDSPGRRNVALTCRCSPSKVTRTDGSHSYELVETPADSLPPALALMNLDYLRLPGEF